MAKKLKEWFDGDCAALIGNAVIARYPSFDHKGFVDAVNSRIANLELKDRVYVIAVELRTRLPDDYGKATEILEASLGPKLSAESGMFKEGYWLMPVARLVEEFGLDDPERSLDLCEEITQRHTAEYAVRPFLIRWPDLTLNRVDQWISHSSSHVRRLASECVRPRLPWARQLKPFIDNPEPALAIAESLACDKSPYVRKSVANLINDVSRDNSENVIALVRKLEIDASPETQWIIRHGTRTLLKSGLLRQP